jgi:single-strand DNA-binding protein
MLIGRLTRDPEVRFLPSGMQATSLSIAVNRKSKDKNGEWREEASFFDIESYGKLAERVGTQLSKGYQILIEGELRQDRWESPSGEKRSKVKIVAYRIVLLGKPGDRNTKSTSTEEDLDIPVKDFESDEDVPF